MEVLAMSKYWALKTREDEDREKGRYTDYWDQFEDEQVVAIGWNISQQLRASYPSLRNILFDELVDELKRTTYQDPTPKADKQAKIAANTILKFIDEVEIGDTILLCQGYTAQQRSDVLVYGFAQVKGPAGYNENLNWRWLKREAEIESRLVKAPKDHLAQMLHKGSLLKTLHKLDIDDDGFKRLADWLRTLPRLTSKG